MALALDAFAQAAAPARGALGGVQGGPDLPFPSIGRLVFGFLFTVVLAVGAAYLLKRWWPMLSRRRGMTTTGGIRTIDRTVVSATLSVYVLEVEGTRYLVAEGRGSLSLTPIQPADQPSTETRV
jgi:flagellar biogenesis protein FliO